MYLCICRSDKVNWLNWLNWLLIYLIASHNIFCGFIIDYLTTDSLKKKRNELSISQHFFVSFISMSVYIYEVVKRFICKPLYIWACLWVGVYQHITASPGAIALLYVSDLFYVIILVLQSEVFIRCFWCEMRKERNVHAYTVIKTKWFLCIISNGAESACLFCVFSKDYHSKDYHTAVVCESQWV